MLARNFLATSTVVAALFALPAAAANFDGLDVTLAGDANISSLLTITPSTGGVGAAWLTTPVSTTSAFSTTFGFDLSSPGGLGMADGLALVFQNVGNSALGNGGGNIGVDLSNAVAAELQTFWNTYGIVQNTDAYGGPFFNSLDLGTDLRSTSQITGTETVAYDPSTHTISQTINLTADSKAFSFNTNATFDLQSLLGPTMFVGLTGATGGGYSDQTITSWTVAAVPEPETYAMMLAGLGLLGFMGRRRKQNAAAA
jgi:hypothetical protein